MSAELLQVHRVERVDDIPVLLATLKKLRVAEILDCHYPSGHRWKGALTFGEVACRWPAFITSQGDHRLNQVQPWAQADLHTLQACLGKAVRPLDFQDDRLADMLDHLALDGSRGACAVDLNRGMVRVYHLNPAFFRVDTTTANAYADVLDELGFIQFGHRKDRADLPQVKVALAALDPPGLPVTTFVVPGNCADDPLYVPEIKKVQQAFGTGGKAFVMDCKGAALGTRAYLASTEDFYLTPLPETQVSAEERRALLQPVWQGRQTRQRVYRPGEDGETEELVAEGFCLDVPPQAEVDNRLITWAERRWLVRSVAFAAGRHKQLDRRLHNAQEELAGLNGRKRGKKRLTARELRAAAAEIVKEQRVQGMLNLEVRTATHRREVRGYRGRPPRVQKEQEHRLEVARCEQEIALAKREVGWRVYAGNQLSPNLAGVVWGYRGQNRLEDGWSRLKGQPLGLMPMYLQQESRIPGLVPLLSLALRLLRLLEWTVRKEFQETDRTLKGLYAGQPGRQANRPSAELLLKAFKGINLATVEAAGQRVRYITPLTALQEKLLDLWGLPPDLYQRLTLHFPEPPPI